MANPKPTVAVFKFSSCDGCQLSLLNMEDELLDLAGAVEIAMFLEATRTARPGPYDIALVEGSVTTEHEAVKIAEIREQSKTLVALGTCATAGGVQALRNFQDAGQLASAVYAHPEYLSYLQTSKPLSDYVKADLHLWGCPVSKGQVLEVITALLAGRKPNLPSHTVCMDCKRRGTSCVMVDSGIPCMGPVTQAGCEAICPTLRRGCYACFGPATQTNPDSLASVLLGMERRPGETARLFRGISGYAPTFSRVAEELRLQGKGVG